jgi:hypothetical protein
VGWGDGIKTDGGGEVGGGLGVAEGLSVLIWQANPTRTRINTINIHFFICFSWSKTNKKERFYTSHTLSLDVFW